MRKRVHWVQRHIANNDLNIVPFQMSLNVRLTVVANEGKFQEWQTWLHEQLFWLQETPTGFEYFLLLVRNIDLVMSVWMPICQIVNN